MAIEGLYKLRYKHRATIYDVLVEASSHEIATSLAESYCSERRFQFISVSDAIVLREPRKGILTGVGSTAKK